MLKENIDIETIVKDVAEFLSQYIKVEMLVLYGSYAYGTPREDSDFDIAVLSNDLEKINILEKIELFAKVPVAIDSRIELRGYTRNDFNNPQKGSFLEMIKKNGKIVYSI
jgi:uncharacterized protein